MTTQTKVTMLQDTYGADGVKYLSNTAYPIDDSVAQILIKNGLARWESGGEASSTVVEPEEQNMVRAEVDPVTGGITSVSPAGIPFVLLQCGVPIGIAPSGTMAANGEVTLGTALNATYSGGIWLYYPSGAVYSGSAAGFFWTVMSSTTLGTVYNNIYVPGTNAFDIPASPTAISAAGPGAFTGVTSNVTALSFSLPGGLLGNHGSFLQYEILSCNNSAGNKMVGAYLGSAVFVGSTLTVQTHIRNYRGFRNNGTQSRQIGDGYSTIGTGQNDLNGLYRLAEDTSVTKTIAIVMNHVTNASDTVVLESYSALVNPS